MLVVRGCTLPVELPCTVDNHVRRREGDGFAARAP